MSEFKYRVWSQSLKVMDYAESIWELYDITYTNWWKEIPGLVKMQFTGLYDKNEEEIYESDTLQFQWLDEKFYVYFDYDYWQYRMWWTISWVFQNFPIFHDLVTIIWNQYENSLE